MSRIYEVLGIIKSDKSYELSDKQVYNKLHIYLRTKLRNSHYSNNITQNILQDKIKQYNMNKIINKRSLRDIRLQFQSAHQFSLSTPIQIQNAQKFITQNFRSRAWSTYVLQNYFPKQLRMPFAAINMFDLELVKVVQNSTEKSLALGKMNFWRTTIQKIYNNQKPNKQPISIVLTQACKNNPLTKGYFLRLIDARTEEVVNRQIQNMETMFTMSQHSKSTLIALNLELLRVQINNKHMQQVIGQLGRAIGICEYLRRVPYGLRNNKFLVPQDILSKYNLQPKSIWDRTRGKPSELLFDAVLQIGSYAKKAFEQAITTYQTQPQLFPEHSFQAFLKGVQTEMYLQDLQKFNFNLFQPGLNKNHPLKLPYRTFYAAKAKKFYQGTLFKK